MALAAFPVEILRQIISNTRPDAYEQTMLSCKKLYRVGEAFLEEYNDFRKFAHIKIEAANDRDLVSQLLGLLVTTLARPSVTEYSKTLSIQKVHNAHAERCTETKTTAVQISQVADLVLQSPWLQFAGCNLDEWIRVTLSDPPLTRWEEEDDDDDWQGEDAFEDNMPAVLPLLTLLLTRLTNLHTLKIDYNIHFMHDEEGSSVSDEAQKVLELMSICADRADCPKGGNDTTGVIHFVDSRAINWLPEALHLGYDDNESIMLSISPKSSAILEGIRNLPPSPLQNLKELHYCPPIGYHQRKAATSMNPFLYLNSIRTLHSSSLQASEGSHYHHSYHSIKGISVNSAGNTAEGNDWSRVTIQHCVSPLEHLDLVGACVDPERMAVILESMPYLTTLRYTHQAKWEACDFDFDAGWVLQAIADPTSDVDMRFNPPGDDEDDEDGEEEETKEDEDADTNQDSDANDDDSDSNSEANSPGFVPLARRITDLAFGLEEDFYGEIVTGVTTAILKQFTGLRKFAVDVRMFLGPDPRTGERKGHEGQGPTVSGAKAWNPETDIPRLIDALPETLEDLELLVGSGVQQRVMDQLLLGFKEGKPERLPNLRRFVVRGSFVSQVPADNDHVETSERSQWNGAAAEAGAEFQSGSSLSWRDDFAVREHLYEVDQSGHPS